MVQKSLDQQNLYPSKNSKNFLKYIKFDLQQYFNMEIMFNGLNRLFRFSNLTYGREAREVLYFAKHQKPSKWLQVETGGKLLCMWCITGIYLVV
jgi:hypothetical protein